MSIKSAAILCVGLVLCLIGLSIPANTTVLPVVEAPLVESRNHVRKVFVFGKDDRTGVPSKYNTLQKAMGVLFKPKTKFSCSAFCVAPDVIATAAHCMMSGKKGKSRPDLAAVYFYRYFPSIKVFARRAAAIGKKDMVPRNMLSDVSFNRRFTATIRKFKRDWALVKLDRAACGAKALRVKPASPKELSKASRKGLIFQLAFHSDKHNMKSIYYSKPCRISNVSPKSRSTPRVLSHKCDTAPGSSGSPIFMDTSSGPVVIGINVGEISNHKILRRGRKIIKRYRRKPKTNTAVNARVFAGRIEEIAKADIFFGTAKLIVMQKMLKEKKFYHSKADGIYGPGMRSAILAYQRKFGLPRNGFPSDSLLTLLSDGKGFEDKLAIEKTKITGEKNRAQLEADKKRRARRLAAEIFNEKADKRHRQKIIEKRRQELMESETATKTN